MKTVTAREFYHNAGLVDRLAPGEELIVTSNGKPKFIVSREPRPRMTSSLARKRTMKSSPGVKIDSVAFLRSLKK
jgi:antitoxin (DNA-binding transcriptional repressor) of toxin-antitoxin stability system